MQNIYQPIPARVAKIKKEAKGVKLFTLKFVRSEEAKNFVFMPGQIIEVGLPGFGEAPFAICSTSLEKDFFQIAVRDIGQLTHKLHQLKRGAQIMIRGPFGNGFVDPQDKDVLLVVGGLGIIPLRSFIFTQIHKRLGHKLTIFYGARQPEDFLFRDEFPKWQKQGIKIHLTIDQKRIHWRGYVGLVTNLFDQIPPSNNNQNNNRLAILCGPPVMYKFVLEKLKQFNFQEKNIYLSLERRMHCGVGICQHCAVGSKYVCKDGPVFCWEEIKNIDGAI